MGSFAYASKILLVVVILVSLKFNNCFQISKFTTLRIKAAIDRFGQACQAYTRGWRFLHWKFTRGESFEEVRDIFIQLKERLQARGVVIDNCCKWKSSLTAIFPDVDIRLDLFYAVQRFLKTVPVGALRCNTCKRSRQDWKWYCQRIWPSFPSPIGFRRKT